MKKIVVFFVCVLLLFACGCGIPLVLNEQRKLKQIIIKDEFGFSGSFFLASGSISGSMDQLLYFYYYDSTGIIRYAKFKVQPQNIGFIEDEGNYVDIFANNVSKGYGIDELIGQNENTSSGFFGGGSMKYIFHIPKDSIANKVDINLK